MMCTLQIMSTNISDLLDSWLSAKLGTKIDVDGSFGAQCVDSVRDFCFLVRPDVGAWDFFKPVTSAFQLWDTYNPAIFDKIVNNHSDTSQLPVAGDIIIFAPQDESQRKKGYYSTYDNPHGHCATVISATEGYIEIAEQNGGSSDPSLKISKRPWRYTEVYGWLRFKNTEVAPAPVMTPTDTYKIKAGDTFWELESIWGIDHGTLQGLNPNTVPTELTIGQEIVIPKGKTRTVDDAANWHTISKGDTFWAIEVKHGMPHGTLQRLNPRLNARALPIGTRIKLR